VPWYTCTKHMLLVQLVLTMLASYERPDFLTLTSVVLTIYCIENSDSMRRKFFRGLVGLIMVSLIYDLAWFSINDFESEEMGGVEGKVKKFSLFTAYISFCFRVSFPSSFLCVLIAVGTSISCFA
jgi:hypothetical protein